MRLGKIVRNCDLYCRLSLHGEAWFLVNGFPHLILAGRLRLSRRNSLKTTSVVGMAGETVVAPDEAAAQSGPPAVGPGEVPVRLNVNGRQIDLRMSRGSPCLTHCTRANLTRATETGGQKIVEDVEVVVRGCYGSLALTIAWSAVAVLPLRRFAQERLPPSINPI
jgi:hypothetical protein